MESSQPEGAAISTGDGEAFAGPAHAFVLLPFPFMLVVPEGLAPVLQLLSFPESVAGDIGQPPASKASIDALRTICAGQDGLDDDCAICLEGLGAVDAAVVKEVPCGHRFHGGCVERWLSMHGSCPLCRFQLPAEAEEEESKKGRDSEVGRGEERDAERAMITFRVPGVPVRLQLHQQQQQQEDNTNSYFFF